MDNDFSPEELNSDVSWEALIQTADLDKIWRTTILDNWNDIKEMEAEIVNEETQIKKEG